MAMTHEPWQNRLAELPLARYDAGETVMSEGTKTGRLLILKSGSVAIVKNGTEIAQVAEPGAVFGEISALLDEPHNADVCTLQLSEFHVADAAELWAPDSAALRYVAMVLARRLGSANEVLLQLKDQLAAGAPPSLIENTVDGIARLLNAIGAGYIKAGAGYSMYPFQ
jgi:CRP/FNR family transcriptional regulator, cyclic AMP receptor protein